MEELTPHVFLDKNPIGLYAGLIHTDEACLQVDANFHPQEMPFYRQQGQKNRDLECYLVTLDTNYDRILSTKGTDCITITQSFAATTGRVKVTSRSQDEQLNFLDLHDVPTSRWIPPEILYRNDLTLTLGDVEVRLEHHSGSNHAGTWVILPQEKVMFIGDTVITGQAPFLAYCNLAEWELDLASLLSPAYKDYKIISSRSGIVNGDEIKFMQKLISFIRSLIEPLDVKKAEVDEYHALIPRIMKKYELTPNESEVFFNRLRWGLSTYYEQIFRQEKAA